MTRPLPNISFLGPYLHVPEASYEFVFLMLCFSVMEAKIAAMGDSGKSRDIYHGNSISVHQTINLGYCWSLLPW